MSAYQTFPYRTGASDSAAKLVSLAIPPLAAKSFLDVGCNEGFFCGYAFFQGARRVLGIDRDQRAIEAARQRFPECVFQARDWDEPGPEEYFDVILCASALEYAVDQERLIRSLMDKLAPEGVLVLEAGMASGREAQWVAMQCDADTRLFPTWGQLEIVFKPYAWKYMGEAPMQAADPLPRSVFHLRRKKPCIFLLLQEPGSGKTSIRKDFLHNCVPIAGDALLSRIAAGEIAGAEALRDCVAEGFNYSRLNQAMTRICAAGLLRDYLDLVLAQAGGKNAVYDGYIPPEYHLTAERHCAAGGYLPLSLRCADTRPLGDLGPRSRQEARKYLLYLAAAMKRR